MILFNILYYHNLTLAKFTFQVLMIELLHIGLLVIYYDLVSFLISLPFQMVLKVICYIMVYHSVVTISSAGVLCIFLIDAINTINKKIDNLFDKSVLLFQRTLNIHIHRNIKQFIEEHNELSHTIIVYNKFWRGPYFVFIVTGIPISLMLMHQLFFEPVQFRIRIVMALVSLSVNLQLYLFQLSFAYLSKQIHKTTKQLSQLQWRLNGWPFRLNNKIKLMTYFERLSSNRKIGFTIGPTIVLTYPIFHQVLNDKICSIILN